MGTPLVSRELFLPGSHLLTVSAEGFAPVRVHAIIHPGEVTDVEVSMRHR